MKTKITDNLSYKFVALGVAIILWISMLGRKEASIVKDFELQLLLGPNIELASSVPTYVRAEIVGPRIALKRINQITPVYNLDISTFRAGKHIVTLGKEGLSLPLGARLVSVEPPDLTVMLKLNESSGSSAPTQETKNVR